MTDFSVHNTYNYNKYQNIGTSAHVFSGVTSPNISILGQHVTTQFRQQPDTVTFSGNSQNQADTQKHGMSNGQNGDSGQA